MAQEEWITPPATGGDPYEAPVPYTPAVPSPLPEAPRPPAPAYQLRPLSLGEILDRTFSIYRSHFWLLAGISSVSAGLNTLLGIVQLIFSHYLRLHANATSLRIASGIVSFVIAILFFLAYSITHATTVYGLSEVYLGKQTTIQESLRATIGKWYRYLGIAIWQMFSAMWIPLLLLIPGMVLIITGSTVSPGMTMVGGLLIGLGFLAIIPGIILFLRNSLGVPASVVEGLKIWPSMQRSKVLTNGCKWRLFVAGLLSYALYLAAGMIESPLAFYIGYQLIRGHEHLWAQVVLQLINFAIYTLIGPVFMISSTLLYFDQRVRLEALDLVMMMGDTAVPAPPAPFTPEAAAPAEVPPVIEEPVAPSVTPISAEPEAAGSVGHEDNATPQ